MMIAWAAGQTGHCQDPLVLTVIQAQALKADAGPDTQIDKGNSATIGGNPTASLGYGQYVYLWTPAAGLNDPTLANPVASPGVTTSYLLTITDAQNCTSTDEVMVMVDASGVDRLPNDLEIRCFPNPVKEDLMIEMTGLSADATILLVNTLGKELITSIVSATGIVATVQIPMRDLPAGVYFLKVITAQHSVFQPILKTRQP